MSQNYNWPAVSVTATNPSVGLNGSLAPTSSTLVAGENPSGDQQPLQTNSSGDLYVTQAPGGLDNVNLTEVGGTAITLGQKTESASIPVVLPSDQTVPISAVSLPLPTGASTSALQTSGNSSLSSINANQTNGTQTTSVLNFPATQPVSGTVTVVQPTGSNLHADIDSSALPTGASTSANQALEIAQLTDINANQTNGTQTSIVTQTTAADLNATVVGSGNFTVVQPTASNLNATVVQPTAANLNATVVGSVSAATPTALTVHQTTLTVGLTAQRLTVSGSAPSSTRVVLVVTPDKSATGLFYIGSSSVSTSSGIQIGVGQVFIANNDAGDYWIVSDTASQAVGIMEQY
jgi:hypothetical protein